jgi:hypothetical protein
MISARSRDYIIRKEFGCTSSIDIQGLLGTEADCTVWQVKTVACQLLRVTVISDTSRQYPTRY